MWRRWVSSWIAGGVMKWVWIRRLLPAFHGYYWVLGRLQQRFSSSSEVLDPDTIYLWGATLKIGHSLGNFDYHIWHLCLAFYTDSTLWQMFVQCQRVLLCATKSNMFAHPSLSAFLAHFAFHFYLNTFSPLPYLSFFNREILAIIGGAPLMVVGHWGASGA